TGVLRTLGDEPQRELERRCECPRLADADRDLGDHFGVRGNTTTNDRSPRFHTWTFASVAVTSGYHGWRFDTSSGSASSGTMRSTSTNRSLLTASAFAA